MKILIIEDEREIAESITRYLHQQNYICEMACSINDARQKLLGHDFDCVLLEIDLADGNGLDILKELKSENRKDAVIIVTERKSVDDKIAGLNLGADDYLSKPFNLSELSARVAAVIRRKQFDGRNNILIHEITIDLLCKTIKVNNKVVDLTRKEYSLLLFFVSNKNRVVTKIAIAEHLWGGDTGAFNNFNFIYAHVKNLKKKLTASNCPDYIRTVYGLGYRFEG